MADLNEQMRTASGEILTEEMVRRNFAAYQKKQAQNAQNPTNVSGSASLDIPAKRNSNIASRAGQNITAGAFDFGNYVNTLGSGEATQDDITSGSASMVQGLLDRISGKASKAEMESDIRKDVEGEGGFNITDLTMQAEDFQGQLDAEQRALDVSKRRLYEEGGLTKAQLAASERELTRTSLQKQADIAILGNAASNKLFKAQSLINDRLNLEYGEQKEQIDDYISIVGAVTGLSNDVKTQLKEEAQAEKDELEKQEANKRELLEMAASVAANNPNLANEFIAMARGEVSSDMVLDAQARSVGQTGTVTETPISPFMSVMQSAIAEGATVDEAVLAAASVSENMGVSVSQDTLNDWRKAAMQLEENGPSTLAVQPPVAQQLTFRGPQSVPPKSTFFNDFKNEMGQVSAGMKDPVGTLNSFFGDLFKL